MLEWLSAIWRSFRSHSGLWNRLTEQARLAIHTAEQIALQHGSPIVEPQHLLYALLSPSQRLVGYLFRQVGVEPSSVRTVLEELLSPTLVPSQTPIRASQETKRALDKACELANRWQSPHIGSIHLLMGLVQYTAMAALLEEHFGINGEKLADEAVRQGMHRLYPPDERSSHP